MCLDILHLPCVVKQTQSSINREKEKLAILLAHPFPERERKKKGKPVGESIMIACSISLPLFYLYQTKKNYTWLSIGIK